MDKDTITMSLREIDRIKVINRVLSKDITQIKAAEILGLSDRHLRRILRRVEEEGDRGVIHKGRGRRSARLMSEGDEDKVAGVIRERYVGFGPTLASEKLLVREGIKVSKEKLRQIMLKRGLWHRRRRVKKVHRWRERKAYYGEMVQMDGSHHEWLEERGPRLVLMGYVDDATNRVFGRFYDHEGVYPAMDSLCRYIRLYGRPVRLYLDKHSTYKTTREPDVDELLRGESAETQFGRACQELQIEVIHAHSPQAKGRIERVFGTLQDRLIKEMRLESISTPDEANDFLERFLPRYNNQFAREPLKGGNLHRRLPRGMKLKDIFCLKAKRTITNDYRVKWGGREFLIEDPSIAIRRRKVEVREHFDGRIELKFNGRYLKYQELISPKLSKELKRKEPKDEPTKKKTKYLPPPDHPWRRHQPSLHHNWNLERVI
jgi:transposase